MFTLGGGAIVYRGVKQSCTANSTMEAEYMAACEAAKEAIWLHNFLMDLQVIPKAQELMTNVIIVERLQIPRNLKVIREVNTLSEDITC